MDTQNDISVCQIFNLENFNFKTQMNLPIDANVHIKTIIDVQTFSYSIDCETSSSKANVNGKLGVKVLYLDTDNVYNTISGETSFSEVVTSNNLSSDCILSLTNENIAHELSFNDNGINIALHYSAKMFATINTKITQPALDGDIITSSSVNSTMSCIDTVKEKVTDDIQIKLPSRATRIFLIKTNPYIKNTVCNDNYLTIQGENLIQVCYEVENENRAELKTFQTTLPYKYEIKSNCQPDCLPYISIASSNQATFTTEYEDDFTSLSLAYELKVCGQIYKTSNCETIFDLYSTSHEIEANYSSRELCTNLNHLQFASSIDGEVQVSDNENIDELLDAVHHSYTITKTYIENEKLCIEGVISTTLLYFSEEKELRSISTDIPFSVARDFENSNATPLNFNLTILSCKTKLRRGNTISFDFETYFEGFCLVQTQLQLLDNAKIGKPLDYSNISFQLIIAKENESVWNFCKRCHITESQLRTNNKEIPPIFQGGEKILVFR